MDDTYSTPAGTTLTVPAAGVLTNDMNPGGGAIVSVVGTPPAHGVVTLNPDGSLTYMPTAGYTGPDTFTYHDVGPGGTSNSATVTIAVTAAATTPTAADDAYMTASGTALAVAAPGVRGNDTNPGGVALAATVVSQPGHGTVALNSDGSFTYIPTAGFVGTDSFTYDDVGAEVVSNVATVILMVTPGGVSPAAPVAVDDTYTTPAGTTLTVPAAGVLTNDMNPGGGAIVSVVGTPPAHGVVTLNPDGSLTYMPTAGYTGPDTFTYQDVGPGGTSNSATVTIAVTAAAAAPTAADDAYMTASGTALAVAAPGVRGNDTNPGGLALAATVVAQPGHGTLALNSDGSFTYIPTAGFVGTDSFTYDDVGAGVASNTATVVLLVTAAAPPTAAPTAVNDTYTTPAGTTLTVPASGVLANDLNPGGGTIVPVIGTPPAHGAVTLNPDGSLTYVPTAGYTGTDSFTYFDVGPGGNSNVATVSFNVTSAFVGPVPLSIVRFGYHQTPTTVVITFSTALDPTSAQNVANYRIIGPGGHQIRVTSAVYDPSTDGVTLHFAAQLNLHLRYTITVIGAGAGAITGATGLGLNSTTAGQPGTNTSATIDAANLIVPNLFGAGATAALKLAARARAFDARNLAVAKLHAQILARAQLQAAAKAHAAAVHAAAKLHATAAHAAANIHPSHGKR